jgi:hypothetical protein
VLPVEQPASAAETERIDINIDGCKKPQVLPGPPRRGRDDLLRPNQVCQRCSPSRTPRCTGISSMGFGVAGLQVGVQALPTMLEMFADDISFLDENAPKMGIAMESCLQCVRVGHVHIDMHACTHAQ